MEFLVILFPLSFMFLSIVITILVKRDLEQKRNQCFEQIAERTGLHLELPAKKYSLFSKQQFPRLTGTMEERFHVDMSQFTRGSGKSKKTYTAYKIQCSNPRNGDLELMREGFLRKVGKAIGVQSDIEVRDDEFDNKYLIKSSEALFAKEFFIDPDFREHFIRYDYAFNMAKLRIQGNELYYETVSQLNGSYEQKRVLIALYLGIKMAKRLEEL